MDPCIYCPESENHFVFLSLITTRVKDRHSKGSEHVATYVTTSKFPFERLKNQNEEEGYRVGPKSTKQYAGLWSLEMCIGPFKHDAVKHWADLLRYKSMWRKSKRNLYAKLQMGQKILFLVREELNPDVKCFVYSKKFMWNQLMTSSAP